ncbi:MAG: tetratricopeptide repeat protein [Clostridia bacterium]|nr:tetratricopeptide repeat protein [Clostridia bacterium]
MAIDSKRLLNKLDNFLRQNDYDSAKSHLLYWLNEANETGDEKAVLLINNELMGLCRKLGQKDEAIFYAESALNGVRKMGIEDNVGAATTYLNSATVFKAFGMASESIGLFERAQEIYEKNLKSDDDRLAGLYNNMALALVDLKRFDEAKALYERAISVLEMVQGKEPEQAITYLNLASCAEAELGLENAQRTIEANIEKAMEKLEASEDKVSGNYAFVCEKCATVFGYYGYFYYENILKERYKRIYEGN